jgi:hypothetical protein
VKFMADRLLIRAPGGITVAHIICSRRARVILPNEPEFNFCQFGTEAAGAMGALPALAELKRPLAPSTHLAKPSA